MSQMLRIEGQGQKLPDPFRMLCIFGKANKDRLQPWPLETKHAGERHAIQLATSKIHSGH